MIFLVAIGNLLNVMTELLVIENTLKAITDNYIVYLPII